MKVEMLVRRVVDGRVTFSVEMVDSNYKGETECVTLTRPPARLTALAVATSSRRCTPSSITVGLNVVEDGSSLKHIESISISSVRSEKNSTDAAA